MAKNIALISWNFLRYVIGACASALVILLAAVIPVIIAFPICVKEWVISGVDPSFIITGLLILVLLFIVATIVYLVVALLVAIVFSILVTLPISLVIELICRSLSIRSNILRLGGFLIAALLAGGAVKAITSLATGRGLKERLAEGLVQPSLIQGVAIATSVLGFGAVFASGLALATMSSIKKIASRLIERIRAAQANTRTLESEE
jgi:hypothetical protein